MQIIAFVAAGGRSYQPLSSSPSRLILVQAVSIGDIANELFSESALGARSLSKSKREAPKLLGLTHFVNCAFFLRFAPSFAFRA
jgi:hypothetical protein